MFVRQAGAQFEFWFEDAPPLEIMRKAAVAGLGEFAREGR